PRTPSLLPLWEKVARTKSATDEGPVSAGGIFARGDRPPTHIASFDAMWPLPQGERRSSIRRSARPDPELSQASLMSQRPSSRHASVSLFKSAVTADIAAEPGWSIGEA